MTAETTPPLGRRAFLAGSASAAAAAVILVSGGAILSPAEAWGYEVKALAPETMRSLVKMARDVYPHDRLADRFYAITMKAHDEAAAKDPAARELVEAGIARLDELAKHKHGVPYAEVGWEADRVRLLREIEEGAFFQKVRAGMVTGLYNQPELWPLFGYEGESAAYGGYLERGFNDIEWL